MTVTKLAGSLTCGITGKRCERRPIREVFEAKTLNRGLRLRYLGANYRTGLRSSNVVRNCGLVSGELALDYDPGSSNVEEMLASTRESLINGSSEGCIELMGTSTSESDPRSVQNELIMLSLPAIAGQAIEPLAQLMETAYIGKMGPLELASAGVSISIFNIVSKVFNIPLLSVATSFVAEDISKNAAHESTSDERKPLSSVSTALLLAVGIGICEALALYLGSGLFLNTMGLSTASSMRIPAERFLKLRALGAPAVVVSLAIQGIFRGFKDTKTPVLCLDQPANHRHCSGSHRRRPTRQPPAPFRNSSAKTNPPTTGTIPELIGEDQSADHPPLNEEQPADLFTKTHPTNRFRYRIYSEYIVNMVNIYNLTYTTSSL